jgi:thiol-disulfide isomerase/thioredoxin
MKAQAWLAAVALIGAAAVYTPVWVAQAQETEKPAAGEEKKGYETSKAALDSLKEFRDEFKDPKAPTPEEVETFFSKAFPRLADHIEATPDATDHLSIYQYAGRFGTGGYGNEGFARIARAYLKANPEAKDKAAWESFLLLCRLGLADETREAQAELKKAEEAAKDDALKLLEYADVRMQWYDKADMSKEKAELLKKLDTDKVFTTSKDEWVPRRIHRMIFANAKAEIKDGEAFPDWAKVRTVKDIDGAEISVAAFKGKVVLIDFWAVWCGPCMSEMPNVIKLYEETHEQGFEVIGISLDSETGKYDLQSLKDTIAGKGKVAEMPWQQIYDGGGWGSGLAKYYGVNSIPKTVLIDDKGIVVAQGLRGAKLDEKVKELLAKIEKKDGN